MAGARCAGGAVPLLYDAARSLLRPTRARTPPCEKALGAPFYYAYYKWFFAFDDAARHITRRKIAPPAGGGGMAAAKSSSIVNARLYQSCRHRRLIAAAPRNPNEIKPPALSSRRASTATLGIAALLCRWRNASHVIAPRSRDSLLVKL